MAIPEHVKQQAMSAVAAVRPNIQAVEHTGNSTPAPQTPRPDLSAKVGLKLVQMEKSGHDASTRIRAMTKDDFVR
jgi:hypothetical protein